jgi:galactosylceramidase
MEVDWISAAQNENGTDRDWIVNSLRPALIERGFRSVRIQAPDCDKGFWAVFDEFENDPAYRGTVEAVGYHYVNGREPWEIDQVSHREATPKAKASGKQLWASEEWSMSGGKWDGTGAMFLARLINKLYIRDHICKTEIWCPIDSIYDGLPWSDTGAMQADTPWSGHYTVWPAIWAVAHTTQFAQPGWKYLDGGCGQIDPKTWKGSYVTLQDPQTGDWSMVVCSDGPATLAVALAEGLKADCIHVWHSDARTQFVKEADRVPANGAFTIALDGNYQNKLSYRWLPAKDGAWKLSCQEEVLASGTIKEFDAARWHAMKIVLRADAIQGCVDGQVLAVVKDASRSNGMAYLASTYDGNLFDNVNLSAP